MRYPPAVDTSFRTTPASEPRPPQAPTGKDEPLVTLQEEQRSRFNRRWAVQLRDGAQVECVLYRGDTLCISSQVGCAVRCPFCASGAHGLARHLHAEEMVGQVQHVMACEHDLKRVTVSGVGEPLHNHAAVQEVVRWCRAQGLGPSLTTSGGPLHRLRQWLHTHHNGLTLSVHAGTEATRARMVPHGPGLEPLFDTLAQELPRISRSKRKKLALAYLLVANDNDDDADVEAFIERALPLQLMVHLYAYNPVPTSGHRRVDDARYQAIYDRMTAAGLRVRMSSKARTETNGGCGTLVALRPKPSSKAFT